MYAYPGRGMIKTMTNIFLFLGKVVISAHPDNNTVSLFAG
jgi:hypothetical protein